MVRILRKSRKSKSACIAFAKGCPRSRADTALVHRYFEANGWKLKSQIPGAELVVVAGCGFDARSHEESVKLLRVADKERDADSKLVVLGCLAGIDRESLKNEFEATLVPPAQLETLDELIKADIPFRKMHPANDVTPYISKARSVWRPSRQHPRANRAALLTCGLKDVARRALTFVGDETTPTTVARNIKRALGRRLSPEMFYIRVSRGCLEECSYCAIKFAAGPLRSKPLDRVMAEFDDGIRKGYKLFNIMADDVGAYGRDIESSVVELLKQLFTRKGDHKFIFADFNVRHIIENLSDMIDLLSANQDRVALMITAIQSGSDRILDSMRRGYTGSQARKSLAALIEAAPKLPIETHVLVGFPGETEEDFRRTLDLLKAITFHSIQIYRYEDRPKTQASRLKTKVPPAIIETRARKIKESFPKATIY